MARAERLMELVLALEGRPTATVKQLADEFGVSRRTMLRDLATLSASGVPLMSRPGPHGGYQLVRDRVLPPVSLLVQEAIALFFALRAWSDYATLPFGADSDMALERLYRAMSPAARARVDRLSGRFALSSRRRAESTVHVDALLDAALDGRVVEIHYRGCGGTEARAVQPIGVYAENGYWYAPAYCFRREGMRVFRVDRVAALIPVDDPKPRADVAKLTLDDYYERFVYPTTEWLPLRVRLTPEGVRQFSGHGGVTVFEDGTGVLEGRVERRNLELFSRIYGGHGESAVVEEPEELRRAIHDHGAALIRLYSISSHSPSYDAGPSRS
jgi:predicted DNA-binding transcriptional regulator YafY